MMPVSSFSLMIFLRKLNDMFQRMSAIYHKVVRSIIFIEDFFKRKVNDVVRDMSEILETIAKVDYES